MLRFPRANPLPLDFTEAELIVAVTKVNQPALRDIDSLGADVQIYALGVFSINSQVPEEREGPELLSQVTKVTGGRTFTIDNPNELGDTATKIGIALRNQYVLGYRPTNSAHDGKWRRIKVKLQPPKGFPPLTVYARTGYYAPSE
jgi:Ca-activated chloride channel homolog